VQHLEFAVYLSPPLKTQSDLFIVFVCYFILLITHTHEKKVLMFMLGLFVLVPVACIKTAPQWPITDDKGSERPMPQVSKGTTPVLLPMVMGLRLVPANARTSAWFHPLGFSNRNNDRDRTSITVTLGTANSSLMKWQQGYQQSKETTRHMPGSSAEQLRQ